MLEKLYHILIEFSEKKYCEAHQYSIWTFNVTSIVDWTLQWLITPLTFYYLNFIFIDPILYISLKKKVHFSLKGKRKIELLQSYLKYIYKILLILCYTFKSFHWEGHEQDSYVKKNQFCTHMLRLILVLSKNILWSGCLFVHIFQTIL